VKTANKFRIYPGRAQISKFENWIDLCRELYNAALQERREAYRLNRISLNYYDQARQLSEIKETRADITGVYSQVLQDILRRLEKTFNSFYSRIKRGEKAGYPRFKGKNFFDSFTFPQSGFSIKGNKLHISKIGKVKIKIHRKFAGKIKTLTIKREIDKWFAIFTVETEFTTLEPTNQNIGIDMGIESFLSLSNGERIENPKPFETLQKKIRILQRSISRKKKGSNRRRKAVLRLKKLHQQIKNVRNDFQHKVSRRIVNAFDLIAIEKLNVKGLSRGNLAKQIHDVAWSSFFQKLKYKAENAGRKLVEVNPKGTSQTCICGASVTKDLSVRFHECSQCGYSNHRDVVSAQVILKLGLGLSLQDKTYRIAERVS
jgi:putative transposase